MYSRLSFSCSRCVSSRRLLCSKRSAYFLLIVKVSERLVVTIFEDFLVLVSRPESLELLEEAEPESAVAVRFVVAEHRFRGFGGRHGDDDDL